MRAIVLSLWLSAMACSPPNEANRPLRSPTLDYPHPPSQTSDGQVVGADRRPPDDTLRMGPKVGPGGVQASEGGPRPELPASSTRPAPPPCTTSTVGPQAAPPCASGRAPDPTPAPSPWM